jgi:hypothetical protein
MFRRKLYLPAGVFEGKFSDKTPAVQSVSRNDVTA